MRFGLVVDARLGVPLADLADEAAHAEAYGFDMVLISEDPAGVSGSPAPFVPAAALAPHVSGIRLGVRVGLGGVNPIYVAEDLAVADLVSNGRLIVAVYPDVGCDLTRFAEAVDVLVSAQAARPFRHDGPTWRIPAGLPANVFNREERLRVTPAPAQLTVPLWLSGDGVAAVAASRALPVLGGPEQTVDELVAVWDQVEAGVGRPASAALRRPVVHRLDVSPEGSFDADAVVAMLERHRSAWAADIAFWRLPAELGSAARRAAVANLARQVWPRVQLDRLPTGLVAEWKRRQAGERLAPGVGGQTG